MMQGLWQDKRKRMVLMTVLAMVVMAGLIALVHRFNTPNPNMILITALVFFTALGGVIPGLVSGLQMIVYSLYFFSEDHSFFTFLPVNRDKMITVLLGTVVCYAIVALVKHNRDRLFHALQGKNDDLEVRNSALQAEADAAHRIEALSASLTSLLVNMPAMSFSKDIETGKYLACNRNFAEYAKKESPEGVIGLTDHEIFDKETADHFVEDDRKAMTMDKPYIFYENVPDAAGSMRHLQTTKMKFVDSEGISRLLGMTVDISELYEMKMETRKAKEAYEEARDESLTFSRIAQTLAADYSYLYITDLDTDRYVEYKSEAETGTLTVRHTSDQFFDDCRKNAQELIYEPDREVFLESFTKENILRSIEDNGIYLIHYRMMVGNDPVYMSMKATRLIGDGKRLVVGISNIDSDMKQQAAAERMQEQRIAFDRVAALSGDYISFYAVDPDTETFRQYNATRDFLSLGLTSEGENFFAQADKDAEKAVYPEDLAYFRAHFTKENVLKMIAEKGIFVLRYRLLLNDVPFYVNIKAALVDEADGRKLIIGTNSIDDQVRQEEAYRFNLAQARERANRDGLTGVKNKMAFDEALAQMEARLAGGDKPEFALVICDVNNLKKTNDTKGHLAGDHLLREACGMICDTFQHSPVFRIGGDEFAVIVQGKDYEQLDALMKNIREAAEKNRFVNGAVVACGAARYSGQATISAVFEEADNRMYENKNMLKLS